MKPRLKTNLHKTGVGDETLVLDRDRWTAYCLDFEATKVFRLCDGEHTVKEIAESLGQPIELTQHGVQLLQDHQLLEGSRRWSRLDRRGLLKLALALPLVTAVAVPQPAAANSCLDSGGCASAPAGECCLCGPGSNCNNPTRYCLTLYCTTGTSCSNDTAIGSVCFNVNNNAATNTSCTVARMNAMVTMAGMFSCAKFSKKGMKAFLYGCCDC